jgi:hypothetical protein
LSRGHRDMSHTLSTEHLHTLDQDVLIQTVEGMLYGETVAIREAGIDVTGIPPTGMDRKLDRRGGHSCLAFQALSRAMKHFLSLEHASEEVLHKGTVAHILSRTLCQLAHSAKHRLAAASDVEVDVEDIYQRIRVAQEAAIATVPARGVSMFRSRS